jgi:hypothetical protein
MQPTHIAILISGLVRTCPVVKFNTYTCLVKLPDGHIVKRHLTKHDGSLGLDLAA